MRPIRRTRSASRSRLRLRTSRPFSTDRTRNLADLTASFTGGTRTGGGTPHSYSVGSLLGSAELAETARRVYYGGMTYALNVDAGKPYTLQVFMCGGREPSFSACSSALPGPLDPGREWGSDRLTSAYGADVSLRLPELTAVLGGQTAGWQILQTRMYPDVRRYAARIPITLEPAGATGFSNAGADGADRMLTRRPPASHPAIRHDRRRGDRIHPRVRFRGCVRGLTSAGGETAQVYDPADNLKFLIGGRADGYPSRGLLGSTGGLARLDDADVIVFTGRDDGNFGLALLVEDGTLALGSAGKSVRFQSAYRSADTDSGLTGAASTLNESASTMSLLKLGAGTLALGNAAYTQLDGATDKTAKFSWTVQEGALRGLSNTDPARNTSNSIVPAPGATTGPFAAIPAFTGGVYEIDNSSGNGGTFTAKLNVRGPDEINLSGGGGFAAYGNPVKVSLDTDRASDQILWEWYTHVGDNRALIFGSLTANAPITLTNPIDTRYAKAREIKVVDNPDSEADTAEISGVLSGSGSFRKTGDGILVLSAPNSYGGGTVVEGGTLVVSNTTGSATGTGSVTINSGARLLGSGTITGDTTLADGATIAPGNNLGTLHGVNQTWSGGAAYEWEVHDWSGGGSGTDWDLIALTGALTIAATPADPLVIQVLPDATNGVISVSGTPGGLDSFVILTATGGISGFSLDSILVDASSWTTKSQWSVRLDGNSLILDHYFVPEPASLALLLLVVAGCAGTRRQRRGSRAC